MHIIHPFFFLVDLSNSKQPNAHIKNFARDTKWDKISAKRKKKISQFSKLNETSG